MTFNAMVLFLNSIQIFLNSLLKRHGTFFVDTEEKICLVYFFLFGFPFCLVRFIWFWVNKRIQLWFWCIVSKLFAITLNCNALVFFVMALKRWNFDYSHPHADADKKCRKKTYVCHVTLERLLDVSSKLAHSDSYASLNVCFCSLLHTWVFSSSSYKKKMKRALKSGDFTIIIWFSSLISAEYDETQHKLDFYLTKFPHDALFLLSLSCYFIALL